MKVLAWSLTWIVGFIFLGPAALAVVPLLWVLLRLYSQNAARAQVAEEDARLERLSRSLDVDAELYLDFVYHLRILLRENVPRYLATVRRMRLDIVGHAPDTHEITTFIQYRREELAIILSCPRCGSRNRFIPKRASGVFRCGHCKATLQSPFPDFEFGD
jgi:hypothetical protein